MKDLTKSGLSIVGILFAFLLLGYTGYQTFTLLNEVSGSPLIAAIGLIMFEVGMLYWWFTFRTDAEGLPQMALSLLVFLACLTFVIMATALQLGAVGADVLGQNTPAKIITAAAVIQLAAKLFFPLLHPDMMSTIMDRVQDGRITLAAHNKFEKRVDGIASEYSDMMVEERTARLISKMNLKHHTQYQIGDRPVTVIEGQAAEPDAKPARRGFFGLFRNRPAETVTNAPSPAAISDEAALAHLAANPHLLNLAVSNSTYAAQPQPDKPNGTPAAPYGGGGDGSRP
jgi:hypothetical protein